MSPAQQDTRRMLDQLMGPRESGPIEALFATTFDLNPGFFDLDFLPSVLGISCWDDYSVKGRLELEQQLERVDTVAIAMEGRRYQGRPRSLRVHLTPAQLRTAGRLHAKVTVLVHSDAVRLLVGSANLTEAGYRHNREVGLTIVANAKRPGETRLIADALSPMRELLRAHWSEHAERVIQLAEDKLAPWPQSDASEDDRFLWGGSDRALWAQFLDLWPSGERIKAIHIVSPFWSPEQGQGPLHRLLQELSSNGCDLTSTEVHLVTEAEREGATTYCPTLPTSLATHDFAGLVARVTAAAVKPIAGDDELRERRLHAKVVLIEGTKTSLAYLGSANFTYAGWGFGGGNAANVEAGVALRRRGKARAALLGLVPATCGEIVLDGSGRGLVLKDRPIESEETVLFPSFLRSVELRPSADDPGILELSVSLQDGLTEAFSLVLLPTEATESAERAVLLTVSAGEALSPIQLDAAALRGLLRQRVVRVVWQAGEADFPVNVSLAARHQLPFGDPELLPREGDLIAFYQGQISFAEAFPIPVTDVSEKEGSDCDADRSTVDTSRILSYQIREFVEALPGIRQELGRNIATPATIRMAFLGPVSPVALAREIRKSATKGRSCTAVGFQLVELLACVLSATPAVELLGPGRAAWQLAQNAAAVEIRRLYDEIKVGAALLNVNQNFGRYEQMLLGAMRGVS